jgi:hypothetical protein
MAAHMGPAISILPRLRELEFRKAINSYDDADFSTSAGRERIVQHLTRALLAFERRMLEPAERRSASCIEAMVRVAMADISAAATA